ncbi:MAG TPA: hypothetical protein VGM81_21735 [Burkholderiaceae bacterium]|jgi:hypothetical protein
MITFNFGKKDNWVAAPVMTWPQVVGRYVATLGALHLPSWLIGWLTHSPWTEDRPLVNLDLVLAAAVSCLNPVVGAIVLIGAWSADILRMATQNYYFLSVIDFVNSARFIDLINLRPFISASSVAAVLGFLFFIWLVIRLTRSMRCLALPLLLTVVLLELLDALNGSSHLLGLNRDEKLLPFNVAGSPAWNILNALKRNPMALERPLPFEGVKSNKVLGAWHVSNPKNSEMLVLVESMGLPRSQALADWMLARLNTPAVAARWTVGMDKEPFLGATTSGELRTLCGLKGHPSRLDAETAKTCLPWKMHADGQHATGFHGFSLRMFDRRDWWPMVGLTAWRQIASDGQPLPMNCNETYPGICDLAVLHEAAKLADSTGQFVYALTLDTHLPLGGRTKPLPADLVSLCTANQVHDTACDMVGRLGDVLGTLATQMETMSTTPLVVVVGDHAPPFGDRENRNAFDMRVVPIMVAEPKLAAQGATR